MSARRGSFLAITGALFAMEARQHAPFFAPYIAFGAALVLLWAVFAFNEFSGLFLFVGFMNVMMAPFFLGGQVFGAEMTDGTARFPASLPVSPAHRWAVKAVFGLFCAAALMVFIIYVFMFVAALLAMGRAIDGGGKTSEIPFIISAHSAVLLWSAMGFSCASFCTLVIRRPLPAVILSVFQGVMFSALALFLTNAFTDLIYSLLLLVFFTIALLCADLVMFTRGRGHLGIASDRLFYGLAGFLLPPAVVFVWLGVLRLF